MTELLAALILVVGAIQSSERPVGRLTVVHPQLCRTLAVSEEAAPTDGQPSARQHRKAASAKTCRVERHKLPKPDRAPET